MQLNIEFPRLKPDTMVKVGISTLSLLNVAVLANASVFARRNGSPVGEVACARLASELDSSSLVLLPGALSSVQREAYGTYCDNQAPKSTTQAYITTQTRALKRLPAPSSQQLRIKLEKW